MIQFTKMQALGNDFVVINLLSQKIDISRTFMQFIADRHYGVGCDQVLLLTSTKNPNADFGYRIFNADGGEVSQCGNGARCLGLFVREKKLSDKQEIVFETTKGLIHIRYIDDNNVSVDIAKPDFSPTSLPFITAEKNAPYHLSVNHRIIEFDVVSLGNPHCVLHVDGLSHDDIDAVGAALNRHPAFPEGVNVGFMQYLSRDCIKLCVYERGVGITKACGSGACAAVAVGQKNGELDSVVQVLQEGGELQVARHDMAGDIQLRGSGETVFDGMLSLAHFKK